MNESADRTDGAGNAEIEGRARAALEAIEAPGGGGLVSAGRVESLRVSGRRAEVALVAGREEREALARAASRAEAALLSIEGIEAASIVLTSHRAAPSTSPPASPRAAGAVGGAAAPKSGKPKLLGGVRRVLAVASGKGGVGKSTVSVNLAVALARDGLSVGLLDADIHGPSLPRMLGLDRRPVLREGRIQPLTAWGVTAISIGSMVDERQALIWRGPMVMGALERLMGEVEWPALDVMVVDMPPGTGDAQLTLAQRVDLAGAIVVSTPQDIALIDARRAVAMFAKTGVEVLGIVENMSVFCCPHCGRASHPFGEGGARREAETLGVPFLGEIPLELGVREAGDAGRPAGGPAEAVFASIARDVRARLG